MTSPDEKAPDEPFLPDADAPVAPVPAPSATPARRVPAGEPRLIQQSSEDTDTAWGEYPESADDRLYRDRPPHWDDF